MNTETGTQILDTAKGSVRVLSNNLAQWVINLLGLSALLVAALINSGLWLQFGISLILTLLTALFVSRVTGLVQEPVESTEDQALISFVENQRSPRELLVIKAAKFWPLLVLGLGLISALLSLTNKLEWSAGLSTFSAVLLLTNVHAVALTIPVAISRALREAAQEGIVFSNRSALENAAKLRLVLFAKSGVLTSSPKGVNTIRLASNSTIKDEHKLLSLAASVESMSIHPLALAICKSADTAKLKVTKPKDFVEMPGLGVQGLVGGSEVLVGTAALLIQRNIRMEVQELVFANESVTNGYTVLCVVVDGHLEGIFRFTDHLKPTAAQAIYLVARERIRVGIITGDSAETANKRATEINVSEVFAELTPERKLTLLAKEKQSGSVGVIADPASDSPLLAAADISIALSDGDYDADVVVKSDDPELAAQVITISSRLRAKTLLGLVFAFSYGLGSLGLFIAIGSPLQVPAAPAIASLLGSLSVLFVSINAYSVGKLK